MALNLKKAKANSNTDSIEPIPVGRYDFIISAGEKKKADTGTEYLEFVFDCLDDEYKNRKVWRRFYLTENAQIFLVRFLESLGLEELTEKENVEVSEIINTVVGKTVSAMTEVSKTNNGNLFNELKNFKVSGNGAATPESSTFESSTKGNSPGSSSIFD